MQSLSTVQLQSDQGVDQGVAQGIPISPQPSEQPLVNVLPPELMVEVFSTLSKKDHAAYSQVSRDWHAIVIDQKRRIVKSTLQEAVQVFGYTLSKQDVDQLDEANSVVQMAEIIHSIIMASIAPLTDDKKTSQHSAIIEALAVKDGRSFLVLQLAKKCSERDCLERTFFMQDFNEEKFTNAAHIARASTNKEIQQIVQDFHERCTLLAIPKDQQNELFPNFLASIEKTTAWPALEPVERQVYRLSWEGHSLCICKIKLVAEQRLVLVCIEKNALDRAYEIRTREGFCEHSFRDEHLIVALAKAEKFDKAIELYQKVRNSVLFTKRELGKLIEDFIKAKHFDGAWLAFKHRYYGVWRSVYLNEGEQYLHEIMKNYSQHVYEDFDSIESENLKRKMTIDLAWYEALRGSVFKSYHLLVRDCPSVDFSLFLAKGLVCLLIGCARLYGLLGRRRCAVD